MLSRSSDTRKSGTCAAFSISKISHGIRSKRELQCVRVLLSFRVQLLDGQCVCSFRRSLLSLAGHTLRAVATKDVRVLLSFLCLWFPPRCLVSRRPLCYRSLSYWSLPRCLPSKYSLPCIDFLDRQYSVSLKFRSRVTD